MILHALCQYYEAMAAKGKIAPEGRSVAKVDFGLELNEDGELLRIVPLKIMDAKGKKEISQSMLVPAQVKKTAGIMPNFMCDAAPYILGVGDNPRRDIACFESSKAFHLELLEGANSEAARAVRAFYENWKPEESGTHPVTEPVLSTLVKGAGVVFIVDGKYAHDDAAVSKAWSQRPASTDVYEGICLVTGEKAPIARLHPSIKGVWGAQSSGASLVSYNAPAFESHGKEGGQGKNGPVGEYAAFAYTTALNHLIADSAHVKHSGDMTIVCWAEDAEVGYQDVFGAAAFDDSDVMTNEDIMAIINALTSGDSVDFSGITLNPENKFYVLGLAPNAARLSVRFFLESSFGAMLDNLKKHYDRLEIVRPAYAKQERLTMWRLLNETVNQNAREKKASPPMAGAVLSAVLTNGAYPASLIQNTMLRSRAESTVTYGRAAIIKAYYLRNKNAKVPEEVLTVQLNDKTDYMPYVLGRLFSVLEAVQQAANPGINTTIKDRYFNSAASTPASIFPLLTNLSMNHLKKLDVGLRTFYDKQMTELRGMIRELMPRRMSLEEQGAFQLGYYHQTQKRYEKKDESGEKRTPDTTKIKEEE